MKLELQERIDHKGDITFWILCDGYAEIPIYRDRKEAEAAFKSTLEFYKNPPEQKILMSEII